MSIQKLFTSRANGTNGNIYVGQSGQMFYNEQTGNLRLSDGVTPGGNPIALGSNRIGNVVFNGTTMSSTGTDQDVTIASNGTGNVYIVGNFIAESTSGENLIESLSNKTINFYVPVVNSLDSGIDIIGDSTHSVQGPQNTGVLLHITGQPNNKSRIYNDGQADYAAYIGRRYNGSSSVPSAISNGNVISRIGATPYTTAGWPALSTARIDFVASQDQTGTNQGSNIQFWTSAIDSNSVSRSLTIDSSGITFADTTTQSTAAIPVAQFGAASGVATLDGAGRLTVEQIPTSLLGGVSYKGVWDADTNTPTLANGVGALGDEYAVTTGGTNLGYTFVAGDWVIYNGTTWDRIPVGSNGVTTFNTRTGAITLSNADVITALAASSIQNSKLQNSSITVNAGTGVTGGGTVSLGSSVTVSIGQDVAANSTPSFAGVTLTAATTAANIAPAADNTYSLGTINNRWKSVHVGPGSLYIQDTANISLNAELTVTNGVLLINGANQLQVGQLKFIDNTIESTAGNIDIQIGQTDSTANLVLNRNVTVTSGKTITGAIGNFTNIDSKISGANAAIVTANTAMKSYVDAVTTAWTSNASTQQTQINSINANVTSANAAISALQGQVYSNSDVAAYLPTYTGNINGNVITATQLLLDAGTPTAASLKLTTGTLLTTPEAGAIEFASGVMYATPNQTTRGMVESKMMYYNTAQVSMPNNTVQQSIFGLTNGVAVSYATRYRFKIVFTARATADNVNLYFALAGSATYYRGNYHATVGKGTYGPGMMPVTVVEVYGTTDGQVRNTINISQGGVGGTYFQATIEGFVDTQYSGYINPVAALSPAPGTSSFIDSKAYMEIYPVGPAAAGNADTVIGNWS